MAKRMLLLSLIVFAASCVFAGNSFAAKQKCEFNGDYTFFFWDPEFNLNGVGFFGVNCAGKVLPGGIIDCNFGFGDEFEDFIEGGSVFLEKDGEGTMVMETASTSGICDTGRNAIELDISVVLGGKTVLFNSDGENYAGSGVIPQAGYEFLITGRADKCFAGQIAGCFDVRFWSNFEPLAGVVAQPQQALGVFAEVGDCTVCVDGAGNVTGGDCRCNIDTLAGRFETLSAITNGGYSLGDGCQSSTGYMWFSTSSDEICGLESSLALDFGVAQSGKELLGSCNVAPFIQDNDSIANAGFFMPCSFEGWLH
jgi:hypothetical protein